MKALIIALLLLPLYLSAQVTKQRSLADLRSDLTKIDLAIATTRAKMSEVKDARFLPDLYFMLAELHVDKSRFMLLIKQLENKDVPIEELDFTLEKRPKFQAIDIYRTILEKFPNLKGRDRALFFIAHEYRELGQLEDMVKTYQQLTSEYPASPYWSEAMIVIGDYFVEQKKDFEMAQSMFGRILSRPPGPYTPLARYKLAWTYMNEDKFEKALLAFEQVLTTDANMDISSLPDIYRQTDIRRDALLALVRPYSEIEPAKLNKLGSQRVNAIDYFYSLSSDVTSYRLALNRLATRMQIKNRFIAATRIYFEALRISTDLDNKLNIVEQLFKTVKESEQPWPVYGYTQEIVATLRLLDASANYSEQEKQAYKKNFEIFARDAATKIQIRAKQTKAKEDYEQAVFAYKAYLSYFTDASKFTNTMLLNLAETQFLLNQNVDAAKTYEKLYKRLSSKDNKIRYMDSALQSYIKALTTPALLSRIDLVQARHGLRDVGKEFLAVNPNTKASENIRFTIARTLYDERDFDPAVLAFKDFLNRHPRSKDAEVAANLILDAFNQREDYDGLVREGSLLAQDNKLSPQLRRDMAEIVKQAQFKKIQADAGDFSSPQYAQRLLKFAEQYKGSSLGDQALFEAFNTFKGKKDLRAYEAGEQLLAKHGSSKYAKAVVTEMGKMALFTADFRRAANYFETYAEKYPLDGESKKLMASAAAMREAMGDYAQAKKDYIYLGNAVKAAEMDFLSKNWSELATSASRLGNSIYGNYYQGLAFYRRGQLGQSKNFLLQASRQAGSSFEEKAAAAHSLYLLSSEALKAYNDVQMQAGNEAQSIQNKSQQLSFLTNQYNNVIRFGNGRWTIAALYSLGQANKEFASFITNAPIPNGLNASQVEQYRSALRQQAAPYQSSADKYFKDCLANAEKFEVFTIFVNGCLTSGKVEVNEERDSYRPPKASQRAPVAASKIRRTLYDEPRNVNQLLELAIAFKNNRDFAMSNLILNRAAEIDPKRSEFISLQGVNWLYMNNFDEAKAHFDRSLKISRSDAYALRGLAALYKQFRFQSRFNRIKDNAQRVKIDERLIHPWMKNI